MNHFPQRFCLHRDRTEEFLDWVGRQTYSALIAQLFKLIEHFLLVRRVSAVLEV